MPTVHENSAPAPAPGAPICDVCGEGNATYHPLHDQDLCPACAAYVTVRDASAMHLASVLDEVLDAWVSHWHSAGVPVPELATVLTHHIGDDRKAERALGLMLIRRYAARARNA